MSGGVVVTERDADPVALLEDLVAIPSVNPRGRPEPAETTVAHHIVEWARRVGLAVQIDVVRDARPNVVVTLAGRDPARSLLLESHLDTVELPTGQDRPLPRVVDGRVYGRGACDAKGSLATFLAALARVARTGAPGPTVRLAAVIDEEHHYRGVVDLLDRHRDELTGCLGAIVGEPTELRLVAAHKGVIRCRLEVTGPGGHSSLGHRAPNPIVQLARAVTALHDHAAELVGPSASPLVSGGSLAVTMLGGGLGENSIPDSATAVVDRRLAPGEQPTASWQTIRDFLAVAAPEVVVHPPHTTDPSLSTDPDQPFVRGLADAIAGRGGDGNPVGASWGSDASKIAAAGIPAVVWGPGSIAQAHTDDEYVAIDQLAIATDTLTDFLLTL